MMSLSISLSIIMLNPKPKPKSNPNPNPNPKSNPQPYSNPDSNPKPYLAYGEIKIAPFIAMLREILEMAISSEFGEEDLPIESFWDLGSGAGKAVIAAHCMLDFKTCGGIEMVAGLHEVALQVSDSYRNCYLHNGAGQAIELVCGDALEGETVKKWCRGGGITFVNCVTWPDETVTKLSKVATQRILPGSILMTVTRKMEQSLVDKYWVWEWRLCEMTFGEHRVNIYTRNREPYLSLPAVRGAYGPGA